MADSTGLVDIIEPTAPPAADDLGVWLALVTSALILALTVYRLRSRRWQARHRLGRLRRRLHRQQVHPRAALFEVASQLRSGLERRRLDPGVAPGRARRQPRWAGFVHELTALRYGTSPPDQRQALRAIAEARRWLRPWT